jgi:acyl carrier protein
MENLNEIKEKVKLCIIDALELKDVTPAELDNDASFFGTEDTPGLIQDSLAVLEIASRLSAEFDVSPTEFNESSFQNVTTLSVLIHKLTSNEPVSVPS